MQLLVVGDALRETGETGRATRVGGGVTGASFRTEGGREETFGKESSARPGRGDEVRPKEEGGRGGDDLRRADVVGPSGDAAIAGDAKGGRTSSCTGGDALRGVPGTAARGKPSSWVGWRDSDLMFNEGTRFGGPMDPSRVLGAVAVARALGTALAGLSDRGEEGMERIDSRRDGPTLDVRLCDSPGRTADAGVVGVAGGGGGAGLGCSGRVRQGGERAAGRDGPCARARGGCGP